MYCQYTQGVVNLLPKCHNFLLRKELLGQKSNSSKPGLGVGTSNCLEYQTESQCGFTNMEA